MSIPDFIIGGAPKCGTTALANYLREHPDVCFCRQKEPRFFSNAPGELERGEMGTGANRAGNFGRGWSWYRDLFSHCRPGQVTGEASTIYLATPDARDLIHRHAPDSRLVFLVRDPVERAYSHYWEEHKLGWELPSFAAMVEQGHPRLSFYVNHSSYGRHLQRFAEAFGREQIHVIVTEEMIADQVGHYAALCRFLGISDAHRPSGLGRRYNQQRAPRSRLLARAVSALHGSRLARGIPSRLRRMVFPIRRAVNRLNSAAHQYPPLDPDVRRGLEPLFRQDVQQLEGWLGRRVSSWSPSAA